MVQMFAVVWSTCPLSSQVARRVMFQMSSVVPCGFTREKKVNSVKFGDNGQDWLVVLNLVQWRV